MSMDLNLLRGSRTCELGSPHDRIEPKCHCQVPTMFDLTMGTLAS